MAYKANTTVDLQLRVLGFTVEHFWALDKSVGWGCTNYQDDVQLVQYLLNVWYREKKLKMDGLFGNKTFGAVKDFQKWSCSAFGPGTTAVDGRVSEADADHYLTKSRSFYTIHFLNSIMLDRRRAYYGDLRMDPWLPTELCTILSAENE